MGPQASETLRRQVLFAMFYAIVGILIYGLDHRIGHGLELIKDLGDANTVAGQ